jgi:RNA polymerase sigma-70 factor, ECF subfamily
LSDHDLLQLVQSGDELALIALYVRHSALVYSVALRILRNPASAEDVLQELFMRLWECPQQIRVPGETLHGWMMIASRNRSISILRKKCPEPLSSLVMASPLNLAKHADHRLMCEKILALLEGNQRILLEMAFLSEMTHLEIASATGYPVGTIKSRIRSALKVLRKTLIAAPEVNPLQGVPPSRYPLMFITRSGPLTQ